MLHDQAFEEGGPPRILFCTAKYNQNDETGGRKTRPDHMSYAFESFTGREHFVLSLSTFIRAIKIVMKRKKRRDLSVSP